MNNTSWEGIIRDRINRVDGKEAQQLIWDILIQAFPDLQTPKMQHDLGNDCYTPKGKIFFACYFPESKYDNKETDQKIQDDYKKFEENWKSRLNTINKWAFVTKDNLMGIPHQRIATLNTNSDGIIKEHWGIEQLVNLSLKLPKDTLKRIYKLDGIEENAMQHFENNSINNGTQILATNVYLKSANEEQEEVVVIDEIFSHILNALKNYKGTTEEGYLHLDEKIKLNFTDENDRKAVANYFKLALTKVKLIEKRVQEAENETQNDLQGHVFGKYYELKKIGMGNMEVLHELFNIFIPKNKERDSCYVNLAKAFVLFYFEDCSIFEKTQAEIHK